MSIIRSVGVVLAPFSWYIFLYQFTVKNKSRINLEISILRDCCLSKTVSHQYLLHVMLFLSCDALRCTVFMIVILSVCQSVCHTRALCPHGSTYDHDFFTIWYPRHSSFWRYHVHPKIRRRSPRARALNEGGVGTNWRFSTNNSP